MKTLPYFPTAFLSAALIFSCSPRETTLDSFADSPAEWQWLAFEKKSTVFLGTNKIQKLKLYSVLGCNKDEYNSNSAEYIFSLLGKKNYGGLTTLFFHSEIKGISGEPAVKSAWLLVMDNKLAHIDSLCLSSYTAAGESNARFEVNGLKIKIFRPYSAFSQHKELLTIEYEIAGDGKILETRRSSSEPFIYPEVSFLNRKSKLHEQVHVVNPAGLFGKLPEIYYSSDTDPKNRLEVLGTNDRNWLIMRFPGKNIYYDFEEVKNGDTLIGLRRHNPDGHVSVFD
jgi:hypothetical protein